MATQYSVPRPQSPVLASAASRAAGAQSPETIARVTGVVPWQDLLAMSPARVAYEVTLPLPYLLLSLLLAHFALTRNLLWLPAALAASFFVFLTGLRVVHNAFHHALGLPRSATELCMFLATLLLLGWMHAVQVTHLLHHRQPLREGDVESRSARMPWWQSILTGPLFPFWVLHEAWHRARPEQRRWIALEVGWNGLALALLVLPAVPPVLRYHIAAMVVGQCLFPFFGVWSVHHDLDRTTTIARTLRSTMKNLATFNMFYHVEHHLFPRVLTCRLRQLAARLDLHVDPAELRHVF